MSCVGIFRAASLLGVLLRLREACTGADSGVPGGETGDDMSPLWGLSCHSLISDTGVPWGSPSCLISAPA